MKKAVLKYLRKLFQEILGELSIEEIGTNPDLMRCVERIDALLCV